MVKIGSAISNPNKIRLLEILMKREIEVSRAAKLMRMPEISVSKLVEELMSDGLVSEKEGLLSITDDGKKVLKSLK